MIDSFYKTLIYDDRYKYILEGLKNTLVIAFFAILIGIILRDFDITCKKQI